MQQPRKQQSTDEAGHAEPVSFAQILSDPAVKQRFEKVRKYFFLRESTYDMSNRCNLQCEGCYYYEGDKQLSPESGTTDSWRALMREEKARGITYVVLAGAEPALVPELLRVCHEEMPLGCIATNGVKAIPAEVGYKIHISVWGNDATSYALRRSKDLLKRQLEAYAGDDRAVFVYTFTRTNIAEVFEVMETLRGHRARATFNVFSPTMEYGAGELRHDETSLAEMRQAMLEVMRRFPESTLFSPYNVVAHTHRLGLHDLFSCPYPRCNPSTFVGLGRSFRQYRADHTWDRDAACCVPDTDCAECRHYAAGSAVVTARMQRHAGSPEAFRAWLDYVDTYLAVWVTGYERGDDLCPGLVAPPGHELGYDPEDLAQR
jgi:MoaA/NifB/PqqE/SkfB family radical SAM enzyme